MALLTPFTPQGAIEYLESHKHEYKIPRVVRLPVSGAFHTSLMKPAVAPFEAALKNTEIQSPVCYVYSNVDGKKYTSADKIIKKLPTQICKPVLWEQVMHEMYQRPKLQEIPQTFTCGPTTSLKTMLNRVNMRASRNCVAIVA